MTKFIVYIDQGEEHELYTMSELDYDKLKVQVIDVLDEVKENGTACGFSWHFDFSATYHDVEICFNENENSYYICPCCGAQNLGISKSKEIICHFCKCNINIITKKE